MKDSSHHWLKGAMLLALVALSPTALAQPAPDRGNTGQAPPGGLAGRPGFGGDFGGRDAGGFLDDVKQQIRCSDEEWKVIGPKLQKVISARQIVEMDRSEFILNSQDGRSGEMVGPPGRGPGGGAFVGPGAGFGGPPRGGRRGFGGPGGVPGGGPAGALDRPPGAPGDDFRGPGGGDLEPPGGFDRPPMPPGGGARGGFGGRRGGFGPGGPGMFRGPRPGGPGPFGRMDPIAQAQSELKAVLDDPKSTPQQIQEKVAAMRKATQKARADLAAAQKDLLELLTADQEVVLVSLGYLD